MKSQSSLEFLMTYGWAVLIIFIVTAVFVNFGLSNPDNYVNERCLFESDFGCNEFGVTHTGDPVILMINLSNSLPYRINITDFEIFALSGLTGDVSYNFGDENPVGVGDSFKLVATFDNPSYGIDLFKARISIKYEILRPGFFPKVVYGSVVSRVD